MRDHCTLRVVKIDKIDSFEYCQRFRKQEFAYTTSGSINGTTILENCQAFPTEVGCLFTP